MAYRNIMIKIDEFVWDAVKIEAAKRRIPAYKLLDDIITAWRRSSE